MQCLVKTIFFLNYHYVVLSQVKAVPFYTAIDSYRWI